VSQINAGPKHVLQMQWMLRIERIGIMCDACPFLEFFQQCLSLGRYLFMTDPDRCSGIRPAFGKTNVAEPAATILRVFFGTPQRSLIPGDCGIIVGCILIDFLDPIGVNHADILEEMGASHLSNLSFQHAHQNTERRDTERIFQTQNDRRARPRS
jgi:hypothetical protein